MNTLFHEFGHALHGLFARVKYPKFAGTNTYRRTSSSSRARSTRWDVCARRSSRTTRSTTKPASRCRRRFVDSIQASKAFNEGFATSEYLAAACLDQAWHSLGADDVVTDVAKFEADALAGGRLDNPAVPTRYSTTYFQHVLATSGYDAGYYS